ncbi:hypothetical protein YYG_00881 [Plasmodium vinckei petteri]|uniref:HTH OST-type domain-containing protein n=1 Tax=Plasmodium vinckei petteri TaxID=138298 RepID=W7B727_PLAVN|nr:hypothetical protein YYG_00881 [Plasmodium vinckei petteri]CAD2106980.1 conserved Plasmodium protein, unknown function [Plasmodium vinckei petteri]
MKKPINTITKNYIEECSSSQNKDVDKDTSVSNIINRGKREAEMQNFDEIKEHQNNINYINKYLTKIFNFEKDYQSSLSKEDTTKGSSGSDDFSETLSKMFTKNNSNIEWELDNTYEFETMDDNNYMKLESSLSKTGPETLNTKNKEDIINNISNLKLKKAYTNGVDGNDNLFSSKLNLNNFNSFNECDNLDKCFPANADVFKFKKDNIPNNEINAKYESLKEPSYQHIKNNNYAKKIDDNLLTRILHSLNEKNDEQNNGLEVRNFAKKNDNYDYSNFNPNNFSMSDINSYEKHMSNGNGLNNKNYNSQDMVVNTLNHLIENYVGNENKNLDQIFNGKDKKNDVINNNLQSPQMIANMYEDKKLLSELNELLSSNNANSQTVSNNIHKYQILLEYINNKIEKEAAHNINNSFTKINEFDREPMERQNNASSNENYSPRPNLSYNPQNSTNRIDNEIFAGGNGNNNIPMIDVLKSKIKFILENENNDYLLTKYIIDTIDEYNKNKYNKGMNVINAEIGSNNKKSDERSFKENSNINNNSERGHIINYNHDNINFSGIKDDKEYSFVVNINNDNLYNTNRMMDKQNRSYNEGVGNNLEGIKFNNSHNENTLNVCNETDGVNADNFKLFLKNKLEINETMHGNNYNMDSNNRDLNNWAFNYDELNRIASIKRDESAVEPNLLSVRNENKMGNSNITSSYMDNNSILNSNMGSNYNYNNAMMDSSFFNMQSEKVGEQNNENIKGLMNESLETYKSIFQHPVHLLNKNNIVLDLDNYEKNSRIDGFQNNSVISNSNNVENGNIINDVDAFGRIKRESEYKKIQTDYYAANNSSKNKQNEQKDNLFNDEYSFFLKSKSAGTNNRPNYDKYSYETRGESYFQNDGSYWEDINLSIRREKYEDNEQWNTVKKESNKFLDKEGKKKLSFFLKKNDFSNSGNETNPVWNRNRNSVNLSRTSPRLSFHNKFDELRKGHTENFGNSVNGSTASQKLKGRSFLNNAKVSKKKKSTEINDKLTMEELKSMLTEKDEANLESLLQSLYDDRILPLLINVKGRADEFHFTDILKNNIKEAYSLFPDKYIIKKNTDSGEDYVIYFLKKKVKDDYFFSTNNLKDIYKPQLWKSFEKYLNEIAQSDDSTLYTFSGGRYGMAKELQRRKLPFFDGLYLGELCHIVHLSTNKKMIAYENNYLKPINQCHKYTNAKLGIANTDDKNMENYIMTISELKLYMNKLLKYYKGGFNISTLKKKLKNRFNKQLCESVFHCIKLIEVLQLKELKDTCVVDSELKIVKSVHDVFP